ncbi:MAG: polymerase, partial [Firmicutes bacterium]|nr:polymerase [Bacillota bacterium]
GNIQLDLFWNKVDKEPIERTIDKLRERFGSYCIQRCIMMKDSQLSGFSPKDDNVIHPVSFFR